MFSWTGALVLTGLTVFAQKPDREKLGFYNYTQPAASVALQNSEFYLLLVELEDNDAYRRKQFEQQFSAPPFRQATTDNRVDFTIKIIEGKFTFGQSKQSSYQEKYKAGGQEKTRSIYTYKGDVGYHYTIKVLNEREEEIFRNDVNGNKTVQGDRSESLSVAHDNFVRNKEKFKEQIMMEQLKELNAIFNEQFTPVEKTILLYGISIKEKKYDYPKFNPAFEDLNRVYDILQFSKEHTDESRQKLNTVIATFEEFVKDATPTEDKSKKNADVTAAAYYNLGLAYFFDQNYKNAHEALAKAASYDPKVMPLIEYQINLFKDLEQRENSSL